MIEKPAVGIIVVNWNDAERTRRCLASLGALDYPHFQVCVVDNGSKEDGSALWRAALPDVDVLRLEHNLGYAGGCNAGLGWARRHGYDYVLLLNNDTTIASEALGVLVQRSHELSDRAILAPKILISREPDRIWSAGGRLRWPWLEREHIGMGEPKTAQVRGRSIDWASGCALFFPLSLSRAVGPLDERYFLYLEDVEWCLRARSKGFSIWFVPEALVLHDVSSSVGRTDSRLLRYYACRNYYFLVFHHGGFAGRIWASLRLAITAIKSGLRLLMFPSYRRDSYYNAQVRALFDVVRHRSGEAPYPHQLIQDPPPVRANVV